MDRLLNEVAKNPSILVESESVRSSLRTAYENLEGTYLVRLFAAFEAGLRSFDRARHNDSTRREDAAVLIDSIGGRRGQGISASIRANAQAVRRVRNRWAHEDDSSAENMSIKEAAARLQNFLSWLPESWVSFEK